MLSANMLYVQIRDYVLS